MDELIERLRSFVVERGKIARGSDIVTACNNSALSLSDLRTLLAALEAAREDAERYRWLRRDARFAGWRMPRQPIPCPDRIAGCMVDHSGGELSGATLDAAIDQARGKGVE